MSLRKWLCAVLLLACWQFALAQEQGAQAAPLDEEFLLFLDEWADDAGGWMAPSELGELGVPQQVPQDEGREPAAPLEDNRE